MMRLNDKGLINSYKTTAKTHTTLDKKYAIPLYAEHLHFLINKSSWQVTNIRAHYTFEQAKLKKEFVIMNQVSMQNAKTDVEQDFYKLLNNSNFGYDCRNNADNCFFNPIYNEIKNFSMPQSIKMLLTKASVSLSLLKFSNFKLKNN